MLHKKALTGTEDAVPEPEHTADTRRRLFLTAGGVAILTLLIFIPALRAGFVEWDDPEYILNNLHIRSFNGSFFKWAFADFYSANWHPLTWISHALDYTVWGLNPLGHHLSSILIHAVNALLVVILSARIFTACGYRSRTLIAAGLSGLLFAVHPLRVESVVWVSERKDLLCGLFFLSSLIAYTGYAARVVKGAARGRSLLAALAFFALALMSKPMAVSLPLVLLILDWYPFGRLASPTSRARCFIEKLPFIALSLASSVVTVFAQRSGGAMKLTEVYSLGDRLLVALTSLSSYCLHLLVPVGLSPLYPYPPKGEISILSPKAGIAAVLLGLMAVPLFLGSAKFKRIWLATWGYFLVTLMPVLGIVQVGNQSMADRYTYLPSLAPLLLIGGVAAGYLAKDGASQGARRLLTAGTAVAVGALLVLTVGQISVWQNGVTLWSYVIDHSSRPLAIAYQNRGAAFTRAGDFKKAIVDLDAAISMLPDSAPLYQNRGVALARGGDFDHAVMDLDKALTLAPDDAGIYYDRGTTFLSKGDYGRAIDDFSSSLALRKDHAPSYYNRGIALASRGDVKGAIGDFTVAISLKPDYSEAYANRGTAFAQSGEIAKAADDFTAAINLRPNYADAYLNRAMTRAQAGQTDGARADFEAACRLGNAEACTMLGGQRRM